jgi:DNA-binding winged helix-turn-helix (wHTH) protein/tetratricopeptide (TPR) repeat protein
MSLISRDLLTFDEYSVDRSKWLLTWRGEALSLNRKTFDLLLYLVDNAPRVVSKDELLEQLWPGAFVEESNLTQHVFLLRKVLSRHESGEKMIVTVPGRGYRFAVPVKVLEEEAAVADSSAEALEAARTQGMLVARATVTRVTVQEEVEEEETGLAVGDAGDGGEAGRLEGRTRWSATRWGVVGVAAAVVLGAAGWWGWQRWEDRASGPPVQVVLTDLDGSTGDAVLDRTLVDAMRIDLTQSPFVSVVSPQVVRRTLTEMRHKPDETVNATLGREVCERTGSQAVLHGSVAKSGEHYLLTEQATGCVDGAALAGASLETTKLEDLPHAVEQLAEKIRLELGESRRTVARFNTELLPATTGSLEALEDFSQGMRLSDEGKNTQAIELLKQAIGLDPQFTAAYLNLATFYANAGDVADDRLYLQKAYELKDTASEPVRRYIVARYHSAVTGDLYESERNFRAWINLYPRSVAPWVGLGEVQRELGHHAEAVGTLWWAQRLGPRYLSIYYGLAMEQMRAGDVTTARATSEQALKRGLDGDLIRMNLYRIGYLQHDAALVGAQMVWGMSHPDSPLLLAYEAAVAQDEGRFKDAERLLDQTAEILRRQGVASAANRYFLNAASAFAELGDVDEAKRLLQLGPVDGNEYEQLRALVSVGDGARASSMLKDQLQEHPQSTLWNQVYGPWLRAEMALAAHNPQAAIAMLEPTRGFDGVGLDGTYLRALAYLQGGQGAKAEAEFRNVLARPQIDPVAYQLPMAWLGLARAQAMEGNRVGAGDAYRHFLEMWGKADADAGLLATVKREASGVGVN